MMGVQSGLGASGEDKLIGFWPLSIGYWTNQTYVDQFGNVTFTQVVQDRCVVKVCQVGHVLVLLVLRRIELLKDILLDRFLSGSIGNANGH